MRAFLILVLAVLVIVAVATGVIYFSSDRDRSTITFDKQRATEVLDHARQSGADAVRRLEDASEGGRRDVPAENPR